MIKRTLLLLMVLISGCALARGPAYQSEKLESGEALIYVYRALTLSGFALSSKPMLLVDDVQTKPLKIGGYIPIHVEPGKHSLILRRTFFGRVLDSEISEIEFQIDEGEIKYFEYAQITTGYKRYGETEVAETKELFLEVPPKYAVKNLLKTKCLAQQ